MAEILFFSRGRGRGHAVPDIAIAAELSRRAPGLRLRFVSYATGASTLVAAGHEVIDLGLDDDAPYLELLVRATRTIAAMEPDLVVSHEEFAALPAARSFGRPTVFVVDFFPASGIWRESLGYADRIVFIDRRGIFPEPPELRGRVRYVGPVVRPLCVSRRDRGRCREELGLPRDGKVISVIPGAWATEERAPILDLVAPAFAALDFAEKRLVWVAGRDHQQLSSRLAAQDAVVLEACSPIEKLMVASDLVLTKANRGTAIDLLRLGIPSLSLSHGRNPIDEAIIPRIPTNLALDARGIDAPFLAEAIRAILQAEDLGQPFEAAEDYGAGGAEAVAEEIVAAGRALRPEAPAHAA